MDRYRKELMSCILKFGLDLHGPHARKFARFRALLQLGRMSDGMARAILISYATYIQQQSLSPNVLPPAPTEEQLYADGKPDIEIGKLADSDLRVGYPMDPPVHCLTAGETGSGKTTSVRRQIIEIDRFAKRTGRRISQLVFCVKRDFEDIPSLGDNWSHYTVHDGQFRMGLNAPQGVVRISAWINRVAEILAARLNLIASMWCLANMIRWSLPVLNPVPQDPLRWLSLGGLCDLAERAPLWLFSGKAIYTETLINQLRGVAQAAGPLLETSSGFDVHRDVISKGRSAVIDVSNLAPAALRSIVIDLIISQLVFSRIDSQHRVDQCEVVVTIDEADTEVSFDNDALFVDGMCVLAQAVKMGRELGISFIFGVTVMGHVSPFILDNLGRQLIFAQASRDSIRQTVQLLNMPQGGELMLPAMPRGTCILRQSMSAWPHSTLVEADFVPPNRTPKTTPYDAHPWLPAVRPLELPEFQRALERHVAEAQTRRLAQSRQRRPGLTKAAQDLSRAAAQRPYWPCTQLWPLIGDPASPKRVSVRRELEGAQLAVFGMYRMEKTGIQLIELTDSGWQFAEVPSPTGNRGRGNIEHRHPTQWIAMAHRADGHECVIEWVAPGTNHPTDLGVCIDGQWHAIEVISSAESNVSSHLNACLIESQAVATVTIVTAQLSIARRLKAQLESELILAPIMHRVRFESIGTYYRRLWK